MYRFATHLSSSHLVLVRQKICDGSCAALIVMRQPARRYAKEFYSEKVPPVSPPPPKKRRFFQFAALNAALLTTAAIVYVKRNPDSRHWLATNIPTADRFIAVVTQEEQSLLDYTLDKLGKVKSYAVGFIFGREDRQLEFQQRAEQNLEKDAAIGFVPKSYPCEYKD